jgi:hypothetical protein
LPRATANGNGNGGAKVPRKWTVMVFMGVAEIEGAADLRDEADADLIELNSVKTDPYVNIFVQRHDEGAPAVRHHIGHGGPMPVPENHADPKAGNALAEFIMWALGTANHGPDDQTLLVLWGHAYQFTVGHAPTSDGVDALDFSELADILADIQAMAAEKYPSRKLDLVGFDACDLSMVEVATVLAPYADYMIASEVGIPLPGWPYHRIFDRLCQASRSGPATWMSPADLGAYIVRQFCGEYRGQRASLTLLNLTKAEEVFHAAESLAKTLAAAAVEDAEEHLLIKGLFKQAQTLPGRPFIDVADLCVSLTRHSSRSEVRQSAATLGDLLIQPIAVSPVAAGSDDAIRPFIVEHGRNAHDAARLQGVSLYAPHIVGADYNWEGAKEWYDKFAPREGGTFWNAIVHAFAARA